MKISTCLLAAAGLANAHYIFPKLITNGQISAEWEFVRRTENKWSREGITSVSSSKLRCYEEAGRPAAGVKEIQAGSTLGFELSSGIRHIGPVLWYMARVPDGADVNTWPASGNVFFKIAQIGASNESGKWKWIEQDKTQIFAKIPASLPNGNYIVRVEQIALHDSSYVGGAQFYLGCGHVKVTGGGSGTPGPLVAFPGAYKSNDPGILIDLTSRTPANYQFPGPAVWQG
ncbi:hypothetical protein FQN57_002876 [Myotisia sp. PD_48]|nr:hypothetical protein FQN57_002876 [Myotisia sp. PD_48]